MDEFHADAMTVKVDRARHRKACIMQCFHIRMLLESSKAREIQPTRTTQITMINGFQ